MKNRWTRWMPLVALGSLLLAGGCRSKDPNALKPTGRGEPFGDPPAYSELGNGNMPDNGARPPDAGAPAVNPQGLGAEGGAGPAASPDPAPAKKGKAKGKKKKKGKH